VKKIVFFAKPFDTKNHDQFTKQDRLGTNVYRESTQKWTYCTGRRIVGRGWPRTVQLDEDTVGTLFYDLSEEQAGGPAVWFQRTPISHMLPAAG